MGFIPIMKKEYPDELMYSWLQRLAKINEISFEIFAYAYLGASSIRMGTTRVEIRNEMLYLYNNIYEKRDLREIYLSLSTFSFESLFMTEGKQTRYINNVFRPIDKLNAPINRLFNTIRLCPECIKEDMDKYGEIYVHRSHHLSGVCTCSKHKIALLEYKGKKGHACDYDLDDYKEIEQVNIDINNEYVSYAQALFESNVCGNILDFKRLLFSRLEELGYSSKNGYENFIDDFMNSKYRMIFEGSLNRFFKITMISGEAATPMQIIPIFMEIYPDVNEVIKVLSRNLPTINTYYCDICGKDYYTTRKAVNDGWNCPYCDKNKPIEERYKQLIKMAGKGLYKPVSMFESLNEHVILHHTICNQDINIKPRGFLFENTRCQCEYVITPWDAKEAIEKDGKYELINFVNTSEPIKVKSKACEHEFPCNYFKFIKSPSCRICKPKNINTEIFKERVKILTGDEYTVLSEYVNDKTKIAIKHNRCGETNKYRPSSFLGGQRCKICTKMDNSWNKWYDLLCEYVQEFGTINIPKRAKYKGKNLGIWTNRQRQERKKNNLSDYQIKKLDELNYCWDLLEAEWNRRYEQYKRYVKLNGNPYISRRTDFEGEHLGAWVETQKKWYKTGKMSKERIDKLLEINPDIFNN